MVRIPHIRTTSEVDVTAFASTAHSCGIKPGHVDVSCFVTHRYPVEGVGEAFTLGVLRFLHEQGRAVPGDVSVVGFDDMPEAEFFTPPLTTVHQDFKEMGRRGLALLLEKIAAGERSARHDIVPTELDERACAAPPRSVSEGYA